MYKVQPPPYSSNTTFSFFFFYLRNSHSRIYTNVMDGLRNTFIVAFKENPVGVVGLAWGTVLGATMFHIRTQKIPFQLKVIQSRIVAQGFLLAGCVRIELLFPA